MPDPIQGLPQGATVEPIAGLPPGASVEPINGLPVGAQVEPIQAEGGAPKPDVDSYWKGVRDYSYGPVLDEAKRRQAEEEKAPVDERLHMALEDAIKYSPPSMLVKMLGSVLRGAYEQGHKAGGKLADTVDAEGKAIKSLSEGKVNEALIHGNEAGRSMSEATGHGAAALIPGFGPAAAEAGEDIGAGKVKQGLGKATALVGQMVAPELIQRGAGALGTKATANVATNTERAALETEATATRTAADEAATRAAAAKGDLAAAQQAAPGQAAAANASRQGTARKQIVDTARESAVKALDEMNYARGKAAVTRDAAKDVHSFGDAADAIQAEAKDIYQKLDKVSDGDFGRLRDSIRQAKKDMYTKDPNQFRQAAIDKTILEKEMDKLFAKHADEMSPADLKAATSAWRRSKILEEVHSAVEGAVSGAPEKLAAEKGMAREVKGGPLSKRLNNLRENIPAAELENALGKEGVEALHGIADLTKDPIKATQFTATAKAVAKQLEADAKIKGAAAKTAGDKLAAAKAASEPAESEGGLVRYFKRKVIVGAAGAALGKATGIGSYAGTGVAYVADDALRLVYSKAMTSPRVAKLMMDAAKTGASPRITAPLIAQQIRSEFESERQEKK
jgi:hypothetical protein